MLVWLIFIRIFHKATVDITLEMAQFLNNLVIPDEHGRQSSTSSLYFCNKDGNVYRLPENMNGECEKALLIN